MLLWLLAGCAGLNFFSLKDDVRIGESVHAEIVADARYHGLLFPEDHPELYTHVGRAWWRVLDSGKVGHRDDFPWQFWILHSDTVNAFALPGGFVYIYTGLIRELDNEDALAGVIGHEIAHADARHTTEQLTRKYGVDALLALTVGGGGLATDIALGLASLDFDRKQEGESDRASVRYLCPTVYAADGAAYFFDGRSDSSIPDFLSTHPDPGDRVAEIRELADWEGCSTRLADDVDFAGLIDALP